MSNSQALALKSDEVNSAVGDLIENYETLVEKLPELAEKVSNMQNNTERMARKLGVIRIYFFNGLLFLYLLLCSPVMLGRHERFDRRL